MKKTILALALLVVFGLTSCTEGIRARKFGGKWKIELKENEEFINVTWKRNNLWVITRDTITGKIYAREHSSYGILEGEVEIDKNQQQ
jgi:hypothetical protein